MALLLHDSHRKIQVFSNLQGDIPRSTGWDTFRSFTGNLLLLTLSIIYFQRGGEILGQHGIALSPTATLIGSATAATGAFISAVFLLISILPSGRAARRARRSVSKRYDDITVVAEKSHLMVTEMVNELGSMKTDLSRHGHDCLALLQRINTALLGRITNTLYLTASGSTKGFIQADKLLRSDLILDENFVDSLISTKPVKPIAVVDIASTVNTLIEEINASRSRPAAEGTAPFTANQLQQRAA